MIINAFSLEILLIYRVNNYDIKTRVIEILEYL
jgi:hypothetical protein